MMIEAIFISLTKCSFHLIFLGLKISLIGSKESPVDQFEFTSRNLPFKFNILNGPFSYSKKKRQDRAVFLYVFIPRFHQVALELLSLLFTFKNSTKSTQKSFISHSFLERAY